MSTEASEIVPKPWESRSLEAFIIFAEITLVCGCVGKEDSKQLALQSPIKFLKSKPCFHTQHQTEKHRLVVMGPEKSASLPWYYQEAQSKMKNYLLLFLFP